MGGAGTIASTRTARVIHGYAVIPWWNIGEAIFTGAERGRRVDHGAAAPTGPERHRPSANSAITDVADPVVIEIPPDRPCYRARQNRCRSRRDVAYAGFGAGGDETVSPTAGIIH